MNRKRATRFNGLFYDCFGPGHWSFMCDDGKQVGPIYRSRAELLGDLERYAEEGGWVRRDINREGVSTGELVNALDAAQDPRVPHEPHPNTRRYFELEGPSAGWRDVS